MPEELVIDSLGSGGDGIAMQAGRTVYVSRTAPGDHIQAEITEGRDGNARGKIIELTYPGPARAKPPCVYYDVCGGCQLQHVIDDFYRDWKTGNVHTPLDRLKIIPDTWGEAVFIPFATRRRVTMAALKNGKDLTLGFYQARTHDIQKIDVCLLLTPFINKLLQDIKPWLIRILKDNTPTDIQLQEIDGKIEMILTGALTRSGEADTGQRKIIAEMCETLQISRVCWQAKEFAEIEPVISIDPVTKMCGEMVIDIPPGSFLQPSAEGEETLVNLVLEAMPKKSKLRIADLFSGCGTFSGPALKFGTVHAVETTGPAVMALQNAAKKIRGLTAERRDLYLEPLTVRELKNYDVVILDPPRAGAKEQCEKLAKSTVQTVISVSCNPSTFARDAKILIDGGYKFKKLTAVDQFIWSPHTEVVGIFSRI